MSPDGVMRPLIGRFARRSWSRETAARAPEPDPGPHGRRAGRRLARRRLRRQIGARDEHDAARARRVPRTGALL